MIRNRFAPVWLCCALLWNAPVVFTSVQAVGQEVTAAQLQALSGEYTNPAEPDTPWSFYPQNGKLVWESERRVPTELKAISATEFGITDSKVTFKFNVDATGKGSLTFSAEPGTTYQRTGPPVHHVFHDYQRAEVMIPMRDGIKLHAVILKPADIATPLPLLIERTPYGVDGTTPGEFLCAAAGAGARRLHFCGRGHSRTLQERRRVCDEPAARRTTTTRRTWTRARMPTTPWRGC